MFRQLIATLLAVFALNAMALNVNPANAATAAAADAVDANQANRAALETVKGIGPGLSGKIIKARDSGSFKNWGDLVERVGGIGPRNAGKLSQAGLTVAGSAYDGTATAPAKAGRTVKEGKDSQNSKDSKEAKKSRKADKAAV